MKKRLISFSLVLVILFSGAFSCLASAASRSPSEFLFDKYWELIHKGEQAIEDIWNIGKESREDAERDLRQILFDQKDFDNGTFIPGSTVVVSFINGSSLVYDCSKSNLFSIIGAPGISSDYYWFVTAHDVTNNRYSSPTNTATYCVIYFLLVPKNADFTYSLSVDSSYFSMRYSGPCIYGRLDGRYSSSGSFFRVSLNNNRLNSNVNYSDYGNITHGTTSDNFPLYSDFDSQALTFTGTFSTVDDLVCTVESSRTLTSQDGSFSIMTGILYDDGIDITYAGSFVNSTSASSGQRWSWSYDLDDFAYYVYRKRCGLDNYYAFISVTKGSDTYYFVTMPLDIEQPGGIFDDVDDPPNWEDYRPDPTPAPEFPDITFVYNPNTNYETINNYTVNANSTFNDYFTYFVESSQTINNNINIISDNIIQFGRAVEDFVENGESACLDYLSELIINFNNDVNAHFDAASQFVGDQFDTLNHNIGVIGDNIVKAIKNQTVPDQEVVVNILNSHFPGFSDIQSGFEEFEPVSDDLVVSIPLFPSETSAADSPESEVLVTGFDPSSGNYVFNISEQLSDPMYSKMRDLMRIFVLGSTFIGAINVFLKIFGLGFSSKDDE